MKQSKGERVSSETLASSDKTPPRIKKNWADKVGAKMSVNPSKSQRMKKAAAKAPNMNKFYSFIIDGDKELLQSLEESTLVKILTEARIQGFGTSFKRLQRRAFLLSFGSYSAARKARRAFEKKWEEHFSQNRLTITVKTKQGVLKSKDYFLGIVRGKKLTLNDELRNLGVYQCDISKSGSSFLRFKSLKNRDSCVTSGLALGGTFYLLEKGVVKKKVSSNTNKTTPKYNVSSESTKKTQTSGVTAFEADTDSLKAEIRALKQKLNELEKLLMARMLNESMLSSSHQTKTPSQMESTEDEAPLSPKKTSHKHVDSSDI